MFPIKNHSGQWKQDVIAPIVDISIPLPLPPIFRQLSTGQDRGEAVGIQQLMEHPAIVW